MQSEPASTRVRARGLSGFAELVSHFGGDCNCLLERAGIDVELLQTPDESLEHEKLVNLLEYAARELNVSDFGLRLAQLQGVSVLGPVALIAQHAPTVEEAIVAVGRNIAYHSPGAAITLETDTSTGGAVPEGMACLRYDLFLPEGIPHRQNSELAYAISCNMLKMVSSTEPNLWRIHFSHAEGLSGEEYWGHVGCEVRLGQPFNALYFPKELLSRSVNNADPVLVETSQRYVSRIIARYPLDLAMQVQELIGRKLAGHGCTLPRVAMQLAMSPATLQRRLNALGVSFDEIADGVRKERAIKFLLHTNLPLVQVSGLVGYAEMSSLNRSCRRWFGDTPQRVRNRRIAQG